MGEEEIFGKVLDADGAPVAGATASCTSIVDDVVAASDERGQLSLRRERLLGCEAVARHEGDLTTRGKTPLVLGRENAIHLGAFGDRSKQSNDRGDAVKTFTVVVESFTPASTMHGAKGLRRSSSTTRAVDSSSRSSRPVATCSAQEAPASRPRARARSTSDAGGRTCARSPPLHRGRQGQPATSATSRRINPSRAPASSSTRPARAPTLPRRPTRWSCSSSTGVPSGDAFDPRRARGASNQDRSWPRRARRRASARRRARFTRRRRRRLRVLQGIGAMLVPRDGGVSVANVVAGGPAEKVGLRRGDRITSIDGTSASGLTVSEAIQRPPRARGHARVGHLRGLRRGHARRRHHPRFDRSGRIASALHAARGRRGCCLVSPDEREAGHVHSFASRCRRRCVGRVRGARRLRSSRRSERAAERDLARRRTRRRLSNRDRPLRAPRVGELRVAGSRTRRATFASKRSSNRPRSSCRSVTAKTASTRRTSIDA